MAIAFHASADLGNNGGTSTSLTVSYTCGAGANRALVVTVEGQVNSDVITGATYAGASMALAAKIAPASSVQRYQYLFYLLNPASGANNVVISATGGNTYIIACAADYTGVGSFDAVNSTTLGTSSSFITLSLTTIADNCWTVFGWSGYSGGANTPFAGSGLTQRVFGAAFKDNGIGDSNGAVHPAGAYSMTENFGATASGSSAIALSFAPFVAAAPVSTVGIIGLATMEW
jgi:hypothetical protein